MPQEQFLKDLPVNACTVEIFSSSIKWNTNCKQGNACLILVDKLDASQIDGSYSTAIDWRCKLSVDVMSSSTVFLRFCSHRSSSESSFCSCVCDPFFVFAVTSIDDRLLSGWNRRPLSPITCGQAIVSTTMSVMAYIVMIDHRLDSCFLVFNAAA